MNQTNRTLMQGDMNLVNEKSLETAIAFKL